MSSEEITNDYQEEETNGEELLDEETAVSEDEGDEEAAETEAESDDDLDSEDSEDEREGTKTLTDEELDHVADTAIETLRSILRYFDVEDASIDEYEGEDGELILDVVGSDLAVLIGRYGKTLDALQFLVASMVNKKIGFRYPIVIDIEGYRNRRRQKLESIAKSSATRCIRSKSDVRLRPMTPYERRIIHIILRNERRVYTESEGDEPNRYVVIKAKER